MLVRARGEILRRERNAQWIAEELAAPGAGPPGPMQESFGATPADPLASRS